MIYDIMKKAHNICRHHSLLAITIAVKLVDEISRQNIALKIVALSS